jgi:integrase
MGKHVIGKLTDTQIKAFKLEPGKKEMDKRDGGGLLIRIRPNTKTWWFDYQLNGVGDKLRIGEYPGVTLGKARERAEVYRAQLDQGMNPRALLEAEAAVAHAKALSQEHGAPPTTLGELFQRWHQDYLSNEHADGGAYIKGIFDRHVLVDGTANLRLDLMDVGHVLVIVQRPKNKRLTSTARRVLSSLRQMIGWAHTRKWMSSDPTFGLKKSAVAGKARTGTRALSEDEITQLHWRMKKSALINRWKHACWLIAATATRVEETMLAERAHVNLVKRTWTIPPENQKRTNSADEPKPHIIYLSDFALRHMTALLAMPGTERFVFPATARGRDIDGPANEKTLSHALGNLQGKEHKGRRSTSELLLEGGEFSSHDLRRTASTLMRELNVAADVIDRCQNHVETDEIRRTYQTSKLRNLMIDGWKKLGAKLEELTSLPDPEPDYVAPKPRYRVVDKTDPVAVARQAAEDLAKAQRKARADSKSKHASAKSSAPQPVAATVDYGDADKI